MEFVWPGTRWADCWRSLALPRKSRCTVRSSGTRHWSTNGYPKIRTMAKAQGADIYFGDAAHIRSDHHAGRTWGKKGVTPVVASTGARHAMSLISAITSKGHMRFMVKPTGGVNADVFIEFLKRLLVGATRRIFLVVERGPAHRAKKTKAFVETLGGRLRLFFLPPYSPDRIRTSSCGSI